MYRCQIFELDNCPPSVQTAVGILVSHWSVARQDFQLPFCVTNQLLAAETDRANKVRQN